MLTEYEVKYLEGLKQQLLAGCDKCNGLGVDNQGQDCFCMKRLQEEIGLIEAAIPEEYREATLENYIGSKTSPQYEKILKYVDKIDKVREKGFNLFLQGESDSGKTFLSACVLREALRKGFTGRFVTMYQLIEEIRSLMEFPQKKKMVEDYYYWSDFLVVDSVERVYRGSSEFVDSKFGDLVYRRFLHRRPVIFNLTGTLNDLKENKFGLWLVETLRAKTVEVTLPSGGYKAKRAKEILRQLGE